MGGTRVAGRARFAPGPCAGADGEAAGSRSRGTGSAEEKAEQRNDGVRKAVGGVVEDSEKMRGGTRRHKGVRRAAFRGATRQGGQWFGLFALPDLASLPRDGTRGTATEGTVSGTAWMVSPTGRAVWPQRDADRHDKGGARGGPTSRGAGNHGHHQHRRRVASRPAKPPPARRTFYPVAYERRAAPILAAPWRLYVKLENDGGNCKILKIA